MFAYQMLAEKKITVHSYTSGSSLLLFADCFSISIPEAELVLPVNTHQCWIQPLDNRTKSGLKGQKKGVLWNEGALNDEGAFSLYVKGFSSYLSLVRYTITSLRLHE